MTPLFILAEVPPNLILFRRSGLQRQLTNSPGAELQINRERLRNEWQTSIEPDLAKIGLKLIRADITAIDCGMPVPLNNS